MLLVEKLKNKKLGIIIIISVMIILSLIYSVVILPKEYVVSSTLMLVSVEQDNEIDAAINSPLNLSNNLISTYSELIRSNTSLNNIITSSKVDVKANYLKSRIRVKKVSNSDTFEIRLTYKNYEDALKLSNELIDNFEDELKILDTNSEVYIINEPHIISTRLNSDLVNNLLFSIVLGTIFSVIYVLLKLDLERHFRSTKELEKQTQLKVLVQIPEKKLPKNAAIKDILLTNEKENSLTNKQFKKLRANIQFLNVNNKSKNIILVTSNNNLEGKTYIASNLGISYASVGLKTIVIDANMKEGILHKLFGIPNELGISNYLSNLDPNGMVSNKLINKYVYETGIKNLNIITAGTVPPNPNELLTSNRLNDMMKDLSVFFDVVIIDATSTLKSIDPLILTRIATSTIIVTDIKKTTKKELLKTKRDIQNVGGRIIGVVLNKAKIKIKKPKKSFAQMRFETKRKVQNFFVNLKETIKSKFEKQKLLPEKVDFEEVKYVEEAEEKNLKEELVEEKIPEVASEVISESVPEEPKPKKKRGRKSKKELEEAEKAADKEIEEIQQKQNETLNEEKYKQSIVDDKIDSDVIDTIKKKENIFKRFKNSISKGAGSIKDKVQYLTYNIGLKFENFKDEQEEKAEIKEIEKEEKKIEEETKEIENKAKKIIEEYKEEQKIKNEPKIDETSSFSDELKNEVLTNLGKNQVTTRQELTEKTQKVIKENKINKDAGVEENINKLIIVIDVNTGYGRLFNNDYFIERPIKDTFGCYYSNKFVKIFKSNLKEEYDLTDVQINRIDPLVFDMLKEYDASILIKKQKESILRDLYVYCLSLEFDELPYEEYEDYIRRVQKLRIEELRKAGIEIEYKVNNLMTSSQVPLLAKRNLNSYIRRYLDPKLQVQKTKGGKRAKPRKSILAQIMENRESEESSKAEPVDNKNNQYIEGQIEIPYEDNNSSKPSKKEILKAQKELLKEEKKEKKKEAKVLKKIKKEKDSKRKKERAEKISRQREEREQKRDEQRKSRALKREQQIREAKIEEELLEDNLYPKTKNLKDI